jgi:hypothetical protein
LRVGLYGQRTDGKNKKKKDFHAAPFWLLCAVQPSRA